jgi:multiple antibiotic resistance protein
MIPSHCLVIAAVALTVYLCYRFAERIVGMLGEGGTNVLVRLTAFILLCIGVQIVWTGVSTLSFVNPA